MALKDTILSSIEAEIEVLKGEAAAEEAAPVAAPAPAPVVEAPKNISPVIQMAIDQAAQRLARETAK